MYKHWWARFYWYRNPEPTGVYKFWYDGPMLAIWFGPFCLDLSYTRFAAWVLRDYFND